MNYTIIFLFSVFVSSASQIILKKSANIKHDNKIKEYLNIKVIIAYFLFFCSTLLTIWAYKGIPLSMGPVFEASGYLWVAVLGRILLKEEVSSKKVIGIVIIIIGIIVACL